VPDLADFDSTKFYLVDQAHSAALEGTLTLLVPEPGTVSLLALGALCALRRRRQ